MSSILRQVDESAEPVTALAKPGMGTQLLTTLGEKVHPGNAAVVVVDMQNDFAASSGWAGKIGWDLSSIQEAAERTAAFLARARQVGVPIAFIQNIDDEMYLGAPHLERNRRRQLEQPRCISGTWGSEFYLVAPQAGEAVIRKHRYSAFSETELNTVLRHWGVQSLLLTGISTETCVESTARDGYFLDYYITLVEDCCATTSPEIHQGVLERCERDWGIVATSGQIMDAWSRAAGDS